MKFKSLMKSLLNIYFCKPIVRKISQTFIFANQRKTNFKYIGIMEISQSNVFMKKKETPMLYYNITIEYMCFLSKHFHFHCQNNKKQYPHFLQTICHHFCCPYKETHCLHILRILESC